MLKVHKKDLQEEEKKEDWGVWENITMLSVKEEKP